MSVKNILGITIEEAQKMYEQGMIFIVKDGKIKGFSLERK